MASPSSEMSEKSLFLAAALDGVLLGGTEQERAMFNRWIEDNRHRVGLVYATGRDPGFLRTLLRPGKVPIPDYVIADVGTTIATVDADRLIAPMAELEQEVADAWDGKSDRVQAALHRVAGLRSQSSAFRYRASYDIDPARFDPASLQVIDDMGLDTLISENSVLDVLPKGMGKGRALTQLLGHLEVPGDRVLVAGRTMRDLSMFELGLNGVVMPDAEPAFRDRVADLENVYLSKAAGAAGIAEAILSFGYFDSKAA
jgi:hydroxymethylpyrimidine pyrophosphatase-like HAD family hydrolase